MCVWVVSSSVLVLSTQCASQQHVYEHCRLQAACDGAFVAQNCVSDGNTKLSSRDIVRSTYLDMLKDTIQLFKKRQTRTGRHRETHGQRSSST